MRKGGIITSRTKTVRFSTDAFGADRDPVSGEREWHVEGDCLSPVVLHLAGRPDPTLVWLGIEPDRAHMGYMYARCRKCEACLKHRSTLWAARAIDEVKCATRTWFGTITIAPEHRVQFEYAARCRIQQRVVDWAALSIDERSLEIGREVSKELTRFLKRARKNSGARFRYLLVQEAHKDGFPHYHLLIHEHSAEITKRTLEQAWKRGFTKFKLVEGDGPTWYVCKYLAKSALARVRASEGYGRACKRLATDRLLSISADLASVVREITPPVPSKPVRASIEETF